MPARAGGDIMKAFSAILFTCLSFGPVLFGSESLDRARQLLKSGDPLAAKTLLAQTAQRNSTDITSLTEYAEYLDRYGDPGARAAYVKLLDALGTGGDAARRLTVTKRLIGLDLLAGDQIAAKRHFDAFQASGGKGLALPGTAAAEAPKQTIVIPG